LDGHRRFVRFGEGLCDGWRLFGAGAPGRGLPRLADKEPWVLLLLRGRDEDVEDLITLPQEDEVGVSAGELEDEGAATGLRSELKEDDPVALDLLDSTQAGAGELGSEALVEGALGAGVALDAGVLEVQAARLRLAGEIHPEDRSVGAVRAREEGEHDVPGRAGLHVAQAGACEEPSQLLDQLADLSLVEVQLSSSEE
jgi:hypothetical protein